MEALCVSAGLTGLPIVYLVMQYTYVIEAFFTFEIPKGVTIIAHKKSTVFPAPILSKLVNTQQHYVRISCGRFRPNRTAIVGHMDINSFAPLSMAWLSVPLCFTNSQPHSTVL